jgi:hypothetical protein
MYTVRFNTVKGTDDKTYAVMFTGVRYDEHHGENIVAWTTRSAFVFPNKDAATEGAKRALAQYEQGETFPNMCEAF